MKVRLQIVIRLAESESEVAGCEVSESESGVAGCEVGG